MENVARPLTGRGLLDFQAESIILPPDGQNQWPASIKAALYVHILQEDSDVIIVLYFSVMLSFHFLFLLFMRCIIFCIEFDRHEIQIYEEVAKMPPFQRKTLVLIGAQGVGRRSLKNRFIVLNPSKFGTTVPCKPTFLNI